LSRDVLRVLRELADAGELELPGADDLKTIRPPSASGETHILLYGRRVAGRNVWVWYRATRTVVELVGATDAPTPPA
jgi:hypothetical protein